MTKRAIDVTGALSVLVGLLGEEVEVTVAREGEPDGIFDSTVAGEPATIGFEEHDGRLCLEPNAFEPAWTTPGYLLARFDSIEIRARRRDDVGSP